MKRPHIILGIFILATTLITVFPRVQKVPANSHTLKIVTTIFPLYDFARNIGGDKVDVSLLLPPGVEAHSFEPKPNDMVNISQSDIFIYTGKFMEPWAADIVKGISKRNVIAVNASKDITRIKQIRKNDAIDPHIWLDFGNDKLIIQTITKAFSEKDPPNARYYQQKAEEYQNRLSMLDTIYKTSLSLCKSNEIVYGGHYAFGYLADRYHLQYFAAQGISPDAEPTAQDLVQLVQQIRKDKTQYVFYEELSSPKIAETLAHETNAQLLILNAAHNIAKQDFESGVSFLSIMEKNLKNLQIGLGCNN